MLTTLIFSAAMGWCGTPYPGWWWYIIRHPHGPGPDPYRISNELLVIPLGIVGGIIAGYSIHAALPQESYATIGLAAFAGGRILSDLGNSVRNSMK